jgi:protein gp37
MNIEKGRYWDEGIQLIDGCTPCSPGCDHCWSAAITHRFDKQQSKIVTNYDKGGFEKIQFYCTNIYGKFNGEIVTHPDRLKRFNTRKSKVFAIWNDLFHEDVSYEFIHETYLAMKRNKQNFYLILTKRAERMARVAPLILESVAFAHGYGFDNIYHGLTVCNQQEADEKIPIFLQVPGKKFLSIEPMLGPIDLNSTPFPDQYFKISGRTGCIPDEKEICDYSYWMKKDHGINAVILGGETLGNRPGREMKTEWVENIVGQCTSAGVPLFIKQIHLNGKVSKNMNEWPEELRVRELPWLNHNSPSKC